MTYGVGNPGCFIETFFNFVHVLLSCYVYFIVLFQEGQVLEISQVNDIRLGLAPKINVSTALSVIVQTVYLIVSCKMSCTVKPALKGTFI